MTKKEKAVKALVRHVDAYAVLNRAQQQKHEAAERRDRAEKFERLWTIVNVQIPQNADELRSMHLIAADLRAELGL